MNIYGIYNKRFGVKSSNKRQKLIILRSELVTVNEFLAHWLFFFFFSSWDSEFMCVCLFIFPSFVRAKRERKRRRKRSPQQYDDGVDCCCYYCRFFIVVLLLLSCQFILDALFIYVAFTFIRRRRRSVFCPFFLPVLHLIDLVLFSSSFLHYCSFTFYSQFSIMFSTPGFGWLRSDSNWTVATSAAITLKWKLWYFLLSSSFCLEDLSSSGVR